MKQVLSIILFFFLISNAISGERAGIVSGQFLKLPTNARIVGMGSAQVALASGVTSLAFNPSGILSVEQTAVASSYSKWFANINHSFIGGVINYEDIGAIGIGTTILSTDDMIETTPLNPEGTGRKFTSGDYAFHLVYAKKISTEFSVGVGAKYIYSFLFNDEITAKTFAFDIGTLYDIAEINTRLGVSITNLGDDIQYIHEAYAIPTALKFGTNTVLYEDEHSKFITAFQVSRPNDADEQYNLGVEYAFQNFALRSGYKFNYDTENLTLGFGYDIPNVLKIDYGFNNFKVLPSTHTFSFEVNF